MRLDANVVHWNLLLLEGSARGAAGTALELLLRGGKPSNIADGSVPNSGVVGGAKQRGTNEGNKVEEQGHGGQPGKALNNRGRCAGIFE